MNMPRALRMSWYDFDDHSPEAREQMREEVERFMSYMDMQSFRTVTGEPHPNEDYEYQPLVAVQRTGNYRR